MYFDGVNLTDASKKRLGILMKIEEFQVALFLAFFKYLKAKCCIDVGSNVGFYSLAIMKYFPGSKVVAFEPTPDTFRELGNNFLLNPAMGRGAQLINMGLSSAVSEIDFLDFGDHSGRNGAASTCIHRKTENVDTIKIKTTCLDEFKGSVEGICCIKIDTEGHEVEVLRGGKKLLKECDCLVQIEVGHGNLEGLLHETLKSYGYERIFKAGPDAYYSNLPALDQSTILDIVEHAIDFLIQHRWGKNPLL